MKAWIADHYYMTKIPAKRLRDNALLHIFPVVDDPAEQMPSQRDDGLETIVWHGEKYEVFSIDLQWENSPSSMTPYTDVGTKGEDVDVIFPNSHNNYGVKDTRRKQD